MLKPYRTIQDVLASPWIQIKPQKDSAKSDRVLRSTKLEDRIYRDLRLNDETMDALEIQATEKLPSFSALSQDMFQSLYSLLPRKHEENALSTAARKFNAPLLEHITQSEDYPTLKEICEGRELPAYEAAAAFLSNVSSELDDLLPKLSGKQGAVNTLEKLEQAEASAARKLQELLQQMEQTGQNNPTLNDAILKAANDVDSKRRQVDAVTKLIDAGRAKNQQSITAMVSQALGAATEKAEEVHQIISSWSSDPGNLQRTPLNEDLLLRVRQSKTLREISKYLGRFREIFAQSKHNSYAYNRGEKYSLELGNDLSRALTSELAMLASPKTLPLFLRKYQRRQIKQYQRREPIYKGAGDIICCLDESGSTTGQPAAWGKAVALTLLEIAESEGRKFALIHFSGPGSVKTDIFIPKQYTLEDKLRAAETFLDGGTDFHTPLNEALRLIQEDSFENADIVFITDGECELSESYTEEFHAMQIKHRFTVTGFLLSEENANIYFSLKSFCHNIYHTGDLTDEQIVLHLAQSNI